MDLTEKSSVVIPPPDYLECLSTGAAGKRADAKTTTTFKASAPASRPEATTSVSVCPLEAPWRGGRAFSHLSSQTCTLPASFLLYLVPDT